MVSKVSAVLNTVGRKMPVTNGSFLPEKKPSKIRKSLVRHRMVVPKNIGDDVSRDDN